MTDIIELTKRPAQAILPCRRSASGEPIVSLIAAMSLDRTIGLDGKLPWRLSTDLARFKAATMGKPVIVGRKTFDDIGRPLPGRELIVVSHSPLSSAPKGVRYAGSIEDAMSQALGVATMLGSDEIFVAGGAEIYRQMMPIAGRILLTVVDTRIKGDARFPDFVMDVWTEVGRQIIPAGPNDQYKTTVLDLRR